MMAKNVCATWLCTTCTSFKPSDRNSSKFSKALSITRFHRTSMEQESANRVFKKPKIGGHHGCTRIFQRIVARRTRCRSLVLVQVLPETGKENPRQLRRWGF